MNIEKIKSLIVFSILMENDEGILGRDPRYIEEKYLATVGYPGAEGLLDNKNLAKYNAYVEKWLK